MQWLRKRTNWCPSRWTSKWKERPTDAEAIQVLQELGSASTYTGNLRALFKTELEKGARLITTATMDRIEGKGLEKGPLVRATGTAGLESPSTPGIWTGATHNRALVSCVPDGNISPVIATQRILIRVVRKFSLLGLQSFAERVIHWFRQWETASVEDILSSSGSGDAAKALSQL